MPQPLGQDRGLAGTGRALDDAGHPRHAVRVRVVVVPNRFARHLDVFQDVLAPDEDRRRRLLAPRDEI